MVVFVLWLSGLSTAATDMPSRPADGMSTLVPPPSPSDVSSHSSTTQSRSQSLAGESESVVPTQLTGNQLMAAVQPAGEGASEAGSRPHVKSMSAAAVNMRRESRMKFAHLDTARAAQVARESFPGVIEHVEGGPPSLPAGQRLVRFVSTHAAQLELPHGKHAVVESLQPMAIETAQGHREPVDLGLTKVGGVFESVRPLVGALIPKKLREGVLLPEAGVSLTPVNAQGAALGGAEGEMDGASVLYTNTQTDTDTAVKPTNDGVEADTILRSVNSPEQLYFRVGMPAGASLVQSHGIGGNGPVRVVSGGREIALVRPPSATDAEGARVPVAMSVRGDLITVSVSVKGGDYQWPIAVDPEVTDNELGPAECYRGREGETEHKSSNWCVYSGKAGEVGEGVSKEEGPSRFKHRWYPGSLVQSNAEYIATAGEYSVAVYHTEGQSKIYKAQVETAGGVTKARAKLELAAQRNEDNDEEGTLERSTSIAENGSWSWTKSQVCAGAEPECPTTAGAAGNLVALKLEATAPGANFEVQQGNTYVYITQENGPEPSFNEEEREIEVEPGVKRLNTLYKAQYYGEHGERSKDPWLSPYSNTAFEVKAHDPGLGVAWAEASFGGFGGFKLQEPIYEDGKCNGVQCKENYHTAVTYNPHMPEGEQTVLWYAADLAGRIPNCPPCVGLTGEATQIVKVDARPPEDVEVSGWSARQEITAAPHTLTISATDKGPGAERSSGVKSITVSVDGGAATTLSGASCSLGPCTASGKYTLAAEVLSEGMHRLVVVATDNAGNTSATEFTFDVRHGTPVPVGPGTVDPTTGQFKLSATDVSLAGAGDVTRVYQSRDLTAGTGGPLGQQWALSLGAGEGMTVLPSGSVVLNSSTGGTTTFTRNKDGEFESPQGDGNVKIEAKEKEADKGVSEYLLQDAKAGTTTVFTQPSGTTLTTPLYANQFGGGEGIQLSTPEGATVDSSGDVWVADHSNNRILEFSPAGTLMGSYGSYGSEAGQLYTPWGVAINQNTGNVYVTDQGNSRVVELSPSGTFVKAFGWGVSNGQPEFQICTTSCQAGKAGPEPGEFKAPAGIAIDSSGNIWVADFGNDRIQEFDEAGEHVGQFGSEGTAEGQFEGPTNIAFSGKDMFVTDMYNARVQKFSEPGTFIEAFGWGVSNGKDEKETCTSECQAGIAGSGKGQFDLPSGIAVEPGTGDPYVGNMASNQVEEISPSGSYIDQFGSSGSDGGQLSKPSGIAISTNGIYVVDSANDRVEEWMRPTWLPTRTEGALKNVSSAYAYKPVEEEGTTVIEPTEELSAVPAGIQCVGAHNEVEIRYLKKGCRALAFEYATSKTATGERESEWGSYAGRLVKVSFIASQPGSESMPETTVAEYAYDSKGRLRAEWDPRIAGSVSCGKEEACSALKTTYGYDKEGHITALTTSGQQPWAFVYGTWSGDPSTGRLLKVTRGQPEAGKTESEVKSRLLEEKELPNNTEAPKLSGTPVVGVSMAVSKGAWSNHPVVYGFQWYDCTSVGCTPILGATNPNYRPTENDIGYELKAVVVATDSGGSTSVATAESAMVTAKTVTSYEQTIDGGSSLTAVSCIPNTTDCAVSDSAGKALYATNVSVSSESTWKSWAGPSGESPSQALMCPSKSLCLLADGKETAGGALYYATSLGGTWTNASSPHYGYDAISCAGSSLCVAGEDGESYLHYSMEPASSSWQGGLLTIREAAIKGVFCLSELFCVSVDSMGYVHVAVSASKIELMHWKETHVDGSTALNSVSCTSTSSCVAVDSAGNVLNLTVESNGAVIASKHSIDTYGLTTVTCAGSSTCVAGDEVGNVFLSQNGGETWTKLFELGGTLSGVSCASTSLCVAVDTAGRVIAFNPAATTTAGEGRAPEPGFTIEYRVPVSGEGATYNMSKEEVEKWGQKDVPREAVAVFSPEYPRGWPAYGYGIASIDYMDEEGRTVNTATPAGGISTTEYNEMNEVTRTLDADNQMKAMAEGCVSVVKKECKSEEVAEKLDTKDKYNGEVKTEQEQEVKEGKYEPGTHLLETKGPEHEIKLANGSEVEARAVTHDYYSQSPKEAEEKKQAEEKNKEEYNLLTKTTEGALLSNGEEKEIRETTTSYSGQEDLGWKLRKPTSTTVEPNGLKLTSTTVYEEETGNVIETQDPGSSSNGGSSFTYSSQFGSSGSETERLAHPSSAAIDAHGNVWVTSSWGGRIDEYSSSGSFIKAYGSSGTGADQFKLPLGIAINHSTGNVYIGDEVNNRIDELNEKGEFVQAWGWGVSNGESKFEICTTSCQAGKTGSGGGQLNEPQGVAIDSSGDVWVTDYANNRVDEFSEKGEFIKAIGFSVTNEKDELQTCKTESECHAGVAGSGNGQFNGPAYLTYYDGDIYVTDLNNNRVEELSLAGEFVRAWGSKGSGNDEFAYPAGISTDASGNIYVADLNNNRIQEFSSTGTFEATFGTAGSGNGQLSEPEGTVITSTGSVDVVDSANNRIEVWAPGNGNPEAHDMRTIYYSSATNPEFKTCGEHPEWANLVCETLPKAQPGTSGLPSLPETIVTSYNKWDEAEKTEEKFTRRNSEGKEEKVAREKIQTYDPAGRAISSEEKATPVTDTSLNPVTNEYNAETGALERQNETINGVTKTITSKDNTLGQLVEYTDAEGNVARYAYEEGGDDRLDEINEGKGKEAEAKVTYSYNSVSGLMQKEIVTDLGMNAAQGTFTASYDIEGKMTSEVYPNGMCANTVYNAEGAATSIEYFKPKACGESGSVLFSDSVVPSIHGETLEQNSTLAKEKYSYDNAGRLLETQETPAGKGCRSRLYSYDEEGNRLSETKRESSTETCPTEGGTVQTHSYDTANRLTDPGVEYEIFGNTTKMPAADAEHEIISTYYLDNQVATERQNEELSAYTYDPAGRTMEAVAENEKTKAKTTTISHYAGAGNALTWTSEGSEKWTRNIPGIDGSLDAIQEAGETPALQLHDLQGNIVGVVGDSESETKLLKTYNSTEFGVPQPGTTPPKYAWLGATGVSTEPSKGGGASTEGGAAYVPQVARNLQTAPIVPPGAFPDGQGTGSQYTSEIPGWYISLSNQESATTLAEYIARQEQIKHEEECRTDPESCAVEDPSKVVFFTIEEAYAFAAGVDFHHDTSYLDVFNDFSKVLGIDFIRQFEEIVFELFTGFSKSRVDTWLYSLADGLEACAEIGIEEHAGGSGYYDAHCWVYFKTNVYHVELLGLDIYNYELPNFEKFAQIQYCPVGKNDCEGL